VVRRTLEGRTKSHSDPIDSLLNHIVTDLGGIFDEKSMAIRRLRFFT
jgi:hypothetical protein